jgi:hypothetical protein
MYLDPAIYKTYIDPSTPKIHLDPGYLQKLPPLFYLQNVP